MRPFLVVPRRTSQTPEGAWVGPPDMFAPKPKKVHVSVVFTWDIVRATIMAQQWEEHGSDVVLGGPAFDSPGSEFIPGKYVRKGIVHTSRGCCWNCQWCYVPRREGQIRELPIVCGNVIQDNNLLACSQRHIEKVFDMLQSQKGIRFLGGLDALLFKPWMVDALRGLSIEEVWFAYDSPNKRKALECISQMRKAGFPQRKLRCYCLIGHGDDSLEEAESRLISIFEYGGLPFAQVYDRNLDPNGLWRKFARTWQRPAATFAFMKNRSARPSLKAELGGGGFQNGAKRANTLRLD